MNTHTIVADVHQNMLKARDDAGGQNLVVSDTSAIDTTWRALTTAQTQNRSASSVMNGFDALTLCLASLGSHRLDHQGPSLGATT